MRRGMLILAGMTAMAGACDFMLVSDLAVGRRCSDQGECPPGQRCSSDGQCLEPCPIPDCVDEPCGCIARVSGVHEGNFAATCLSDGLCHWICDFGHQCAVGMACVEGLCYAGCFDGKCPSGRECVAAEYPYCRYSGDSTQDGGLNDGGGCTQCGDTCVDLQSDTAHCGACDHSCAGGACEAGICRALQIGGLAFGDIVAFGQDAANLYMADAGEGALYSCPKTGCDNPPHWVVMDSTISSAIWVGAEGAHVYFATTGGDLWACSNGTCGGPSRLYQFGSGALRGGAVDPSGLYLATASDLLRCDLGLAPCAPSGLYPGDTLQVEVRGGRLLFAVFTGTIDEYHIDSCDTPDCFNRVVVVGSTLQPYGLASSDTNVYWWAESNASPGSFTVHSCPKTGCDPVPILVSAPVDAPGALAASALGAFFTSADSPGLTGWSEALQERRQFEHPVWISHVVADDYYVFFADAQGDLYRLAPW